MKKIILLMLLVVLATTCFGAATPYNIFGRPTEGWLSGATPNKDPAWAWMKYIDSLVELGVNPGTGQVFYVDSSVTNAGDGSSWLNAKATIEEAYDLCEDNRGDIVLVAQGHAETLGTLVLDTAGVTIRGIGNGEDIPQITYDTTSDIITISGASNTIINLSLLAGVHAIEIAFNITADGDYTSILGCEFPEPATNTFDFKTAIQLATASDNVTVAYCTYKHADAIGPVEFIDGGPGAVQGLAVWGNYLYSEFSAAAIFSDQNDLEVLIAYNTITNMTSNLYAIQMGASATGWLIGNKVATDTYATAIEAGGLAVDDTTVWVDYGQTDIVAVPYFANTTGVARMSATEKAEIEVEANDALVAENLDHLMKEAESSDVTTDSVIAHLASATGTWATFDDASDSLEAIADTIAALSGIGFRGTCETNTYDTNSICGDLSGFGNDYFNTGWSMICIYNNSGAGTAPEGEIIDITDYISSTGTFTVGASFTEALTASDEIYVRRVEELNLDDPTMLDSAGTIRYVDSAASGDGSGLTWENADATIALAEAACSAGDVVYVADGHNEAIGSLVIDVANTQFIGLGKGDGRPILDYDAGSDEITINAAGVVFKNFRLFPGANDVVAGIVLGANGDGVLIENCAFIDGEGADEEFRDCVTFNTATVGSTVRNCTYKNSSATAADQDTFVNLDAATIADASVIGCTVFGTFAEAPIWWGAAVPTNALIKNNTISNTTASQFCIEGTGNATGICQGNMLFSDDYATILDPGYLKCINNWAVDAIDEQAIQIPLSAETSDVTEVGDGSDLERLEYLQNKSDDILAGIRMAGGSIGNVFYVDDATGGTDGGTTWDTAEATLATGFAKATANKGDIIFLAPEHAETILTGSPVTLATAGVTVIGIGEGAHMPTISLSGINSSININAASIVLDNIAFHSTTADTTIGLDVKDAGDDSVIRNCVFTNVSGLEFVDAVEINDDADRITVENCEFYNTGGVDAKTAIRSTAGTCIGLSIISCRIEGAYDDAGIYGDDIDTLLLIKDNIVTNTQTGIHAIEFDTTASGMAIGNMMYADTVGAIFDPGSMYCFENYETSAIDTSGKITPSSPGELHTAVALATAIDGGDVTCYTIAGGPILVRSLFMIMTEATDAAGKIGINAVPTAGSETPMSAVGGAGLELNAAADAGDIIYSLLDSGILILADTDGTAIPDVPDSYAIVPIGIIEIDMENATTTTGIVDVYMQYEILLPGTTVTVP